MLLTNCVAHACTHTHARAHTHHALACEHELAGNIFASWFAGLSQAQLKIEIAKAFKKFDTDGSGYLDAQELKAAFELMVSFQRVCVHAAVAAS